MKLNKIILVGLMTLGALALNTSAHADDKMGEKMERFHQAQMDRLKTKLKLEQNQMAAWDTFLQKSKPPVHDQNLKAELDKLSTPDRMKKLQEVGNAHFTAHYEAVSAFYSTLSAEQKKTFDVEFAPSAQEMRNKFANRMNKNMDKKMAHEKTPHNPAKKDASTAP